MSEGDVALIARRRIRASRERLFEAWTTPAHLTRWWGPKDVACTGAEIDLRVGGRFAIDHVLSDGSALTISGEFLVIEPPSRLVFTWRVTPSVTERDAPERVTVRFEPGGEWTEVVVVHERIPNRAVRDGHIAGWRDCLDGLETFVH